ncbi:hypothetical protein DYB35_012373, partial [Aphanomyces astaci]
SHTYIFGFHPHGIIPMTVMWLQFTDQWRELFPNVFACPLSASVVHYFPGIRDVIQVLGAREVTCTTTFSDALKSHQSIFAVPGGQAELVVSVFQQRQVSGVRLPRRTKQRCKLYEKGEKRQLTLQ